MHRFLTNFENMTKKEVLETVGKYYAYHRTNNKSITSFKLINDVEVVGGKKVKGYGVYFNFDKNLYQNKGKYLFSCALTIKNPFITDDQIYTALITKEKKEQLYKKGFDSVVLFRSNKIIEVICFTNAQIVISEVS
jgi:hypothetical protein